MAVYIGAGFDPVRMNMLTELWVGWPLGTYSATRAWSPGHTEQALAALHAGGLIEGDTLTERGRQVRQEIEDRTDDIEAPLVEAIGAELDWVLARLTEWGNACIKADAFPPNPLKRAAG